MAAQVTTCPTCHRRMTRSNQANRRYFKLLTRFIEKFRHIAAEQGAVYTDKEKEKREWHEHFVRKFLGEEEVPGPDGTMRIKPIETSKLPTPEFNDYAHEFEAWAAQHGVWLDE